MYWIDPALPAYHLSGLSTALQLEAQLVTPQCVMQWRRRLDHHLALLTAPKF
jgi:hypothetical protein